MDFCTYIEFSRGVLSEFCFCMCTTETWVGMIVVVIYFYKSMIYPLILYLH